MVIKIVWFNDVQKFEINIVLTIWIPEEGARDQGAFLFFASSYAGQKFDSSQKVTLHSWASDRLEDLLSWKD